MNGRGLFALIPALLILFTSGASTVGEIDFNNNVAGQIEYQAIVQENVFDDDSAVLVSNTLLFGFKTLS